MVKKRIIVVVTILVLLAMVAGCGGKATQTAATTPATQTTPTAEKTTTAPPTTTATSKPTTTQKPTTTTTTVVEIQPTETPEPTETQEPEPTETQEPEPTETPEPVVFTFTSSAFGYSEPIPRRHAYIGVGQNISPALEWSGAPEGTVSFALIMEDPDGGMWSHWVVFNIPSDVLGLAEGIPTTPTLASGALQGRNDFGGMGYGGPSPPSGTHRYYFRLYALDTMLDLASGATRQQVINAMQGHILEQLEYMGTYSA